MNVVKYILVCWHILLIFSYTFLSRTRTTVPVHYSADQSAFARVSEIAPLLSSAAVAPDCAEIVRRRAFASLSRHHWVAVQPVQPAGAGCSGSRNESSRG